MECLNNYQYRESLKLTPIVLWKIGFCPTEKMGYTRVENRKNTAY